MTGYDKTTPPGVSRGAASRTTPHRAVKRVLVTGGGGYIGSNLVARFLREPGIDEVHAGVRNQQAAAATHRLFPNEPRLNVVAAELPETVWNLEGIDTIVHAAAWISLRHNLGNNETYARINVDGTRIILERARAIGIKRLVFLSTQAVYGTRQTPPWREDTPEAPETPYAISKAQAERLCLNQPPPAIPTVVMRVAKVYGAGLGIRWQDVPHKFVALTSTMQPLTINGGGTECVDLLHIRDLAEAVVRACVCHLPAGGAMLNIGGGTTHSIRQLAELCHEVGRKRDLTPAPFRHEPATSVRVRKWGMHIDLAREILNWTPTVLLRDAIEELFDLVRADSRDQVIV